MQEHRLCRRKEDFHLAVGGFAEGVNHPALCVDVAEEDGVLGELHVAEADNLATKRATLLWRSRPVDELSPTAAGDDVAGWIPRKFQVLKIVVMAGDPEIHLVLAKERVPVVDKDLLILVDAVGVERMVRDAGHKGGGARLGQLGAKPGVLLPALLLV